MLLVAPPSAQNAEKSLAYRLDTKVCGSEWYTTHLVPSLQAQGGTNSMPIEVVDEASAHRIAKNLTDRKPCLVSVQVKVKDSKTGAEKVVGSSASNLYLDRPYYPDGYGGEYLLDDEYTKMKPILEKMNQANPMKTFTFYRNMLDTTSTPGVAVYLVAQGVRYDW
jgi:hypothetical protein